MRRWSRSTAGSAVGVVLAASLVVLASPASPSSALPSNCDLTWDGGGDHDELD